MQKYHDEPKQYKGYLKSALDAAGDRLIDTRNRALLAVGYDTLLRRSELVSLKVSDFLVEIDGTATLLVRAGKTDADGRGATPCATSCAAEKDRVPKRRTVIATDGLAGGTQMATREPSSRRASRIGVVAGSRPKGRAIWIAARSSAAASSAGASIGR